jgi:ABC-type transporter Mla subunit MlaD
MISRHAKAEFRVGLFLLACVALFVGSLISLGIQKDLFAERVRIYIVSTTGENVEPGIPLRLSGFRVGQVADVELTHGGEVVIAVDLLKRYRDWLRADSQIILVQGGFIGKTYLQLVPGSQDAPLLEAETRIPLNHIGGLDEILAEARPVIEDLKAIVANVKEITAVVADDSGPVRRVLDNAVAMSDDLRSERGLVGYVTRNPEPVRRLDSLLAHTDQAMERIAALVDSADARVQDLEPLQREAVQLAGEVRAFVAELRQFREDLRPAVDNAVTITRDIKAATGDLDRLRARTEHTLRLGTELLERLGGTWPLSSGPQPRPPDEHPLP